MTSARPGTACEDTVVITFTPNPSLTIDKVETSAGPYVVGNTLTYDIVVTNTGNVTLTNVTVSDTAATLGACVPANGSDLAPLATMTCAASHLVTQTDVDAGSFTNTGSVTDDDVCTAGDPACEDTVVITFTPNPSLTIDKVETSAGPYVVGNTLTYDIVVTNTGNVTLTNVTVSDTAATLGACVPANGSDLAPLATMTCAASHLVTQTDVDAGSFTNTGSVTDDDVCTAGDPACEDTVVITFTPNPSLTIDKVETSAGPYVVGNTLTYDIVVTNTGNVTLTNVTVSDTAATLGACVPANGSDLAPLATMTCAASHLVTQTDVDAGSFTNTGSVTDDDVCTAGDPACEDTVVITFTPNPSLTIDKVETSAGPYVVGNTLTYDIVVTNTGNVTLTNVTVSDTAATLGACVPANGSDLAPLATMTCAASHLVTQTDVDAGSFTNTGSVTDDDVCRPGIRHVKTRW